jgi:formylglycine-generating enzyme required for sulfatase activity
MSISSVVHACLALILVAGVGCGSGGSDLVVDLGNGVSMRLVEIKPGVFMMGDGDRGPQHEVTISKAFWLGQTEVTQAQWLAVMGTSHMSRRAGDMGDLDHPVAAVTWIDAQEFCRRLSEKTGMTFRLPTEAEWEYACRAGTTTAYSFGDDPSLLGEYAWFRDNADGRPQPVASKKPNAWGLYDMHGNVQELCADWRCDYPSGAVTDPQGPRNGRWRVLRGGQMDSSPDRCRAAVRSDSQMQGFEFEGLRVAITPAEEVRGAEEVRRAEEARRAEAAQADAAFVAAGGVVVDLGSGVSMRLVEIKPGTFMMGRPASERASSPYPAVDDETPQHEVTISKAFWLGQTEVTQAQWHAVMGTKPSRHWGQLGDPDLPVASVSWDDAQEFCWRLSEKTGMTFRLPTEAEWEYACRSGTTTAYSFGDDAALLDEHAWIGGNTCGATQPVATKKANEWGLYDMHGNVWEWCSDWYGHDYYAVSPAVDPLGPQIGTERVVRGGGLVGRVWHRDGDRPDSRIHGYGVYGFRVAMTP